MHKHAYTHTHTHTYPDIFIHTIYLYDNAVEWHEGGIKKIKTMCDWSFVAEEGSVSSPEHWLPKNTTCKYEFHRPSNHHQFEMRLNIYGLRYITKKVYFIMYYSQS